MNRKQEHLGTINGMIKHTDQDIKTRQEYIDLLAKDGNHGEEMIKFIENQNLDKDFKILLEGVRESIKSEVDLINKL